MNLYKVSELRTNYIGQNKYMIFTKTAITDVFIIEPELRSDERGHFFRVFGKDELKKINISYDIAQINRSLTIDAGMIRGMHYQRAPKAEDKIVQCLQGALFDVALDIRPNSPTFGKWISEKLTAENKKMLLVPKGFAHGFQALEPNTIAQYFVSAYYSPEYESGVRWNDPLFDIKWPIKKPILSAKDSSWPNFEKK